MPHLYLIVENTTARLPEVHHAAPRLCYWPTIVSHLPATALVTKHSTHLTALDPLQIHPMVNIAHPCLKSQKGACSVVSIQARKQVEPVEKQQESYSMLLLNRFPCHICRSLNQSGYPSHSARQLQDTSSLEKCEA